MNGTYINPQVILIQLIANIRAWIDITRAAPPENAWAVTEIRDQVVGSLALYDAAHPEESEDPEDGETTPPEVSWDREKAVEERVKLLSEQAVLRREYREVLDQLANAKEELAAAWEEIANLRQENEEQREKMDLAAAAADRAEQLISKLKVIPDGHVTIPVERERAYSALATRVEDYLRIAGPAAAGGATVSALRNAYRDVLATNG